MFVYDKNTVFRYEFRKFSEWMSYVIYILEKVKVVGVYIQDNSGSRMKFKKTVCVLTCFSDKVFWMAYADVSAYSVKNTAYGDCRVFFCRKKNLWQHRSCSGFSVCSWNADCIWVVLHDLTYHLSSLHHRNAEFFGTDKFRIVRVNSRCIDNQVNVISDIFCFLSVYNIYTCAFEMLCDFAFFYIWTTDIEIIFMEQLSKTAHTDSADAYEKYFAWIIKIYLVHNATVLSVLISYYSLYYKHWLEKYNCKMKM